MDALEVAEFFALVHKIWGTVEIQYHAENNGGKALKCIAEDDGETVAFLQISPNGLVGNGWICATGLPEKSKSDLSKELTEGRFSNIQVEK